jgi:hypothetical protein
MRRQCDELIGPEYSRGGLVDKVQSRRLKRVLCRYRIKLELAILASKCLNREDRDRGLGTNRR